MPDLYIGQSKRSGRGVFSNEPIEEGDTIEFCPMIVLNKEDRPHLDKTGLYDYYFDWGEGQDQAAIALGYGSIYNHDPDPNAVYETYFEEQVMVIKARRKIDAHEEIVISYRQDPDDKRKVWFQ